MAMLAVHPSMANGIVINGQELRPAESRSASDGDYIVFGSGLLRMHALIINQAMAVQSPTALIPFDSDAVDRLHAADRLWHAVNGRHVPDRRLTPQRRQRITQMLRAVDGKTNNASYREIAEGIFGAERVQADLWHESSLRYATLRLVRGGSALVAGGYRDLLRWRPSR